MALTPTSVSIQELSSAMHSPKVGCHGSACGDDIANPMVHQVPDRAHAIKSICEVVRALSALRTQVLGVQYRQLASNSSVTEAAKFHFTIQAQAATSLAQPVLEATQCNGAQPAQLSPRTCSRGPTRPRLAIARDTSGVKLC